MNALPGGVDIQAEVDRFVASLRPAPTEASGIRARSAAGRPARCAASPEAVYARASTILDEEGDAALTLRRLAGDLNMSTRTLYKRIHSRENMLRQIATTFVARLDLTVRPQGSWRSTVLEWCARLHGSLTAHPHLADLISDQIGEHVSSSIDDLLQLAAAEGIAHARAVACCQSLVSVTINDALAGNRRAPRGSTADTHERAKTRDFHFVDAISLILDGALPPSKAGKVRPRCADDGHEVRYEYGAEQMNRAELNSFTWALADIAKPLLGKETRAWLHARIGAGDLDTAIVELLHGFAQTHSALPIELATQLRAWIAGYSCSEREVSLQRLADQIPVRASSDRPREGVRAFTPAHHAATRPTRVRA